MEECADWNAPLPRCLASFLGLFEVTYGINAVFGEQPGEQERREGEKRRERKRLKLHFKALKPARGAMYGRRGGRAAR